MKNLVFLNLMCHCGQIKSSMKKSVGVEMSCHIGNIKHFHFSSGTTFQVLTSVWENLIDV